MDGHPATVFSQIVHLCGTGGGAEGESVEGERQGEEWWVGCVKQSHG